MNKYESLIIVEGITDIDVYSEYFKNESTILWFPAFGKPNLCNTQRWNSINYKNKSLIKLVDQLLGEPDFHRIILIVDSDFSHQTAFKNYSRNTTLEYIDDPIIQKIDNYWSIDKLNGSYGEIPIYGFSVPISKQGCLETELLDAYGYPKYGQPDYAKFEDIVKTASKKWDVHKNTDNQEWFDINPRARMDKFIYNALSGGFSAVNQETHLLNEPDIIKHIKEVLSLS